MSLLINKAEYSLFGNSQKDCHRFLYDAYLPCRHSEQGIPILLTPDKQKKIYEKICKIEAKILKQLNEFFDHRIWPVERRIIIYTIHCFINALERVEQLLEYYPPNKLRFNTTYGPLKLPLTAAESISRLRESSEIYEQILISLLRYYNIEIRNDLKYKTDFVYKSHGFLVPLRIFKAIFKYLRRKYSLLSEGRKKLSNNKSLVLMANKIISMNELADHSANADFIDLKNWVEDAERSLVQQLDAYPSKKDACETREMLRKRLNAIQFDDEEGVFKYIIPVLVDNYPVSLLEARQHLIDKANVLLEKLVFSKGYKKRIIMSVDHRIWKNEIVSALAAELVKQGHIVINTAHGSADGYFDYSICHTVDQCLVNYYMTNFEHPFPSLEKQTPKIIHVNLLSAFESIGKKRKEDESFTICYFPHWIMLDPSFCFFFYGLDNPEGFWDNQMKALAGLIQVSSHLKVKEIIIKLRPDMSIKAIHKYNELVEQVLKGDRKDKISLVSNLSSKLALSKCDISVHDMFSSTFVESLWAGIPAIVLLSDEAEVPSRFPDRENWLKTGVFVRRANELYECLLNFIENKIPENYEELAKNFLRISGLGQPTAAEALKVFLQNLYIKNDRKEE